MTIRLQGQTIQVDFVAPVWNSDGGKMGTSTMASGVIQINKDMPPDQQAQTLLHEVVHQIADMNALSFCDDETTVACLANALMGFLRDNPKAARQICDL